MCLVDVLELYREIQIYIESETRHWATDFWNRCRKKTLSSALIERNQKKIILKGDFFFDSSNLGVSKTL